MSVFIAKLPQTTLHTTRTNQICTYLHTTSVSYGPLCIDFFIGFCYTILNQGGFNLTCPTFKWTKQGVVICKFSYTLCRILHSAFIPVLVAT